MTDWRDRWLVLRWTLSRFVPLLTAIGIGLAIAAVVILWKGSR